MFLKVVDIVRETTVDGPGFRTAVYLAGCSHHCPKCHNPHTWSPFSGHDMTVDDIMEIVRAEGYPVTLTGGDPLFNPEATQLLVKALHKAGISIWLYTGYTWEEIITSESLLEIVKLVDVVVDGKFDSDLSDKALHFRGSSNQRIINVELSLMSGYVVKWEENIPILGW